jgi:hypothetical protein
VAGIGRNRRGRDVLKRGGLPLQLTAAVGGNDNLGRPAVSHASEKEDCNARYDKHIRNIEDRPKVHVNKIDNMAAYQAIQPVANRSSKDQRKPGLLWPPRRSTLHPRDQNR